MEIASFFLSIAVTAVRSETQVQTSSNNLKFKSTSIMSLTCDNQKYEFKNAPASNKD